ncbi:MAG: hypothetical protein ABIH00_05010 [Armatimonadota bacterium]
MKSEKGAALITVFVLLMVMFSFAVALSVVIDKNLKYFSFMSRKETARSLARGAIEYAAVNGCGTDYKVAGNTYTTKEIQISSDKPYYFEIQDTDKPNEDKGEYYFIGIVKSSTDSKGKEVARAVLKVKKPVSASEIKSSWIE